MSDERLLVILGPTGSGKSALALALGVELLGEIVGCDALQVYSGFDRATAKPTAVERRRVPHHLIDCVDPCRDFSLAEYVRAAERAIGEIRHRGRVPLVVGGSGLYLRGLLRGVVEAPGRDAQLRSRLLRIVERGGAVRLHRWLEARDPRSALRIAAGDTQRLIRALELAHSAASWSERLAESGSWAGGTERFRSLKVGLDPGRERLGARLDARVDRFFESGLIEEVRALLAAGVPQTANAFKAIGYREVLRSLGGDPPRGDSAELRAEVRQNTRRYAKRQRTWFRREAGVVWLDATTETVEQKARVLELLGEPRG